MLKVLLTAVSRPDVRKLVTDWNEDFKGGLYENVPRMFSSEFDAVIEKKRLNTNSIFDYLMEKGVSEDEMFHTFNMGTGFVICINSADEKETLKIIEEAGFSARTIGEIKKGSAKLCLG